MKVVYVLNNWKSRFSGIVVIDPKGRAKTFPCAIGKGGMSALKREGDGATPIGRHRLLKVFYRPDRVQRPITSLPIVPIQKQNGWCDHVFDRNYNRPVPIFYPASHEKLYRDDHLYDLMVVLDYNISSRKQNAGSAIFLHLARHDFSATEGCVALSEHVMRLLLAEATPKTDIVISL